MTHSPFLREEFEESISLADRDSHALKRDTDDVYLCRPTRLLWAAVSSGEFQRSVSHRFLASCYLMLCLLDTIEATGGLTRTSYGSVTPAIDEDWPDLGDACEKMLGFLKREAGIPEDVVTITDTTREQEIDAYSLTEEET